MNNVRTIPALFVIMISILITAGCILHPAADNHTNNASVNGSTFTPIITPVQAQCPAQKNVTPWIQIDPIGYHGYHYIGDVFEITGTTNVGVNNSLSIYISKLSNYPSQEHEIRGIVRIQSRDCDGNVWSFSTNTSDLRAGFYDVVVSTENLTISNWTGFHLTGKFPFPDRGVE